MQAAAVVVALTATVVALVLVARAATHIVRVVRLGAPDPTRTGDVPARVRTTLREVVGHTRMMQWHLVGVAHWFVMVGFVLLFLTLVTAYGQIFDPHFALPLIGRWWPSQLVSETIVATTTVGILVLIVIRLLNRPGRLGRSSRFAGSTMWQGYYVEYTILIIAVCIMSLRGLEGALLGEDSWSLHHAWSYPLVMAAGTLSTQTLETAIVVVAAVKIVVSMAWFGVIAVNLTMGVAWHRFAAPFNIFFKRHADGATSLGALQPIRVGGQPLDFENLDDLDEDAALGVGKVEQLTWKNVLDLTTCTECGRCQSQCPAWNTEKPLSPKLVITDLRDHMYAKAPYLLAEKHPTYLGASEVGVPLRAAPVDLTSFPADVQAAHAAPLVGTADEGGVIDPDVLWSCTTCGACVQQCPVDIEHVDTILDLRRYQVLIETSYPTELNALFKNLEKAGNPWGVNASKRMDWAADLPFEVPQLGGGRPGDPDGLGEVEWLFWVGCAGAFEDRAKKTTRAVAELLHIAGVSFAVLGEGETCTGDPARRAGNEFLYQQLALENSEVLRETGARKVVATCAHCFNTLKNEYAQLGVQLEVVHHTQLLNRLVRDGRLTPVAPPATADGQRELPVTYHDPCYLGRHNQVYTPPRDLLGALPGLSVREMPRNSERSFCCGAGGARMWMEERIGSRINANRTAEALGTGATAIAVACPFCRVMLADAVTAAQHDGTAPEEAQVVDVAQLLLDAVRRGREPEPAAAGDEVPGPEPDPALQP